MLDNREKTPWRDYGHQIRVSHVNITTRAVVPAWTAGTQVDMDMSGRILRAWMPAIHAGMTEAGDWPNRVKRWHWRGGMCFHFHPLRTSVSS
jgi:hypothetical protein